MTDQPNFGNITEEELLETSVRNTNRNFNIEVSIPTTSMLSSDNSIATTVEIIRQPFFEPLELNSCHGYAGNVSEASNDNNDSGGGARYEPEINPLNLIDRVNAYVASVESVQHNEDVEAIDYSPVGSEDVDDPDLFNATHIRVTFVLPDTTTHAIYLLRSLKYEDIIEALRSNFLRTENFENLICDLRCMNPRRNLGKMPKNWSLADASLPDSIVIRVVLIHLDV